MCVIGGEIHRYSLDLGSIQQLRPGCRPCFRPIDAQPNSRVETIEPVEAAFGCYIALRLTEMREIWVGRGRCLPGAAAIHGEHQMADPMDAFSHQRPAIQAATRP